MNRLQKFNPTVGFVFFILSILSVLVFNSLVFSLVSLICALLNSICVEHKKTLKTAVYSALVVVFATMFNMIFVHHGETVLFEIKEIKFTLEALTYGVNQGLIISSVFIWFKLMSKSLDSERVSYLLRHTPKLALMLSMILGFIPRFSRKLNEIRDSRLGLNGGERQTNKKERLNESIEVLSALITYSLEGSIITANSMEGRGYDSRAIRRGRYKFSPFDIVIILSMIALICVSFLFYARSKAVLLSNGVNIYVALSLAFLAGFELIPCIMSLKEEILWRLSNAKA